MIRFRILKFCSGKFRYRSIPGSGPNFYRYGKLRSARHLVIVRSFTMGTGGTPNFSKNFSKIFQKIYPIFSKKKFPQNLETNFCGIYPGSREPKTHFLQKKIIFLDFIIFCSPLDFEKFFCFRPCYQPSPTPEPRRVPYCGELRKPPPIGQKFGEFPSIGSAKEISLLRFILSKNFRGA